MDFIFWFVFCVKNFRIFFSLKQQKKLKAIFCTEISSTKAFRRIKTCSHLHLTTRWCTRAHPDIWSNPLCLTESKPLMKRKHFCNFFYIHPTCFFSIFFAFLLFFASFFEILLLLFCMFIFAIWKKNLCFFLHFCLFLYEFLGLKCKKMHRGYKSEKIQKNV